MRHDDRFLLVLTLVGGVRTVHGTSASTPFDAGAPRPGHPPPAPAASTATRVRRRRRPSGEPPPLPRELQTSGRRWLLLVGVVVVALVAIATVQPVAVAVDVVDHTVLNLFERVRASWLTPVARAAGVLSNPAPLGMLAVWWATLVVLVIWRRWRHLLVSAVAMFVVTFGISVAADIIQRPRPLGVEILGAWDEPALPSRPMAFLTAILVTSLYTLVPAGRLRERGKLVVAGLLGVTAFSRFYLAQEGPFDVLFGVVAGVGIPLAAFRLFVPNDAFPVSYRRGRTAHLDITGDRHDAITHALEEQLGVIPVAIKPFNLEGSGGSTPLRITVKGDPETHLFAKLYSATHLRSDRWYKLGRELLYGRLEDEKPFHTVRRLIQQEDYLLRLMRDAGLPVPSPYGVVEITPEREYLLVTEFLDGAQEIGEVDVDDDLIDQGLGIVRRLWEAGLAHRDIKPANLMVRDGRLHLIDTAFGELRPSPWRQAVDLGNMMLVLALRATPERVYERARQQFSVEEITEAFAATRGLTMPSQLRRMMRQQGRDLHAEFAALLPEPPHSIPIQRWTVRRVALIVGLAIAAVPLTVIVVTMLAPI
jgi:tRNA A-37 threonylcarbamoyl transferase component Bud32